MTGEHGRRAARSPLAPAWLRAAAESDGMHPADVDHAWRRDDRRHSRWADRAAHLRRRVRHSDMHRLHALIPGATGEPLHQDDPLLHGATYGWPPPRWSSAHGKYLIPSPRRHSWRTLWPDSITAPTPLADLNQPSDTSHGPTGRVPQPAPGPPPPMRLLVAPMVAAPHGPTTAGVTPAA